MAHQLDILALEPFYGGVRRVMLDSLIHCSRHRWTLLKLPPRRIERRLSAAAHWFAEQLSRHWVGRTNLLFTSEAMNLSDLYRLVRFGGYAVPLAAAELSPPRYPVFAPPADMAATAAKG